MEKSTEAEVMFTSTGSSKKSSLENLPVTGKSCIVLLLEKAFSVFVSFFMIERSISWGKLLHSGVGEDDINPILNGSTSLQYRKFALPSAPEKNNIISSSDARAIAIEIKRPIERSAFLYNILFFTAILPHT